MIVLFGWGGADIMDKLKVLGDFNPGGRDGVVELEVGKSGHSLEGNGHRDFDFDGEPGFREIRLEKPLELVKVLGGWGENLKDGEELL